MIAKKLPGVPVRLVLGGILTFSTLSLTPFSSPSQGHSSVTPGTDDQTDESSFYVSPEPAQVLEPTELRVTLSNAGDVDLTRYAQFAWSSLGIGQIRQLIGGRIPFTLPAHGSGHTSVVWIPQNPGGWCFFVDIYDAPAAVTPVASFQHNTIIQAHPDPTTPYFVQDFSVPLRNPLLSQATFALVITASGGATNWNASVNPHQVVLQPGEVTVLQVEFTYTGSGQLPPGGKVFFELSASAGQQTIGTVEFVFGPPLKFQTDPLVPSYAASDISIRPYPLTPGEPAEICANVRNVTQQVRQGLAYFLSASMGIGLPYALVAPPVEFTIPELGTGRPCIQWVPSASSLYGFEVQIETSGYPMLVSSQRVIDAGELLLPGTTSTFQFAVRNPSSQVETIDLSLRSSFRGYIVSVDPPVLANMGPGESRLAILTVQIPPDSLLPADGEPVVDVEAMTLSTLVGGFRKIYQPPVPVRFPGTPAYAEDEILVHPYPPQDHEPTEICAELRNPTSVDQVLTVDFREADFGIGLPWSLIRTIGPFTVEAQSLASPCITWIPPHGGRFSFEIEVHYASLQASAISQRVIDVGEVLLPNQSTSFAFPVGNPYAFPIGVTLGAIRHLSQWGVTFTPSMVQLAPGATSVVQMTVNPVQRPGDPDPSEGQPVIDIEAYWEGNGQNGLLGGFRKLFFPPVLVHQPADPSYAEREISISPYPPFAGEPTRLAFEVRNPTSDPQQVDVTFEVASIGIGLPFQAINTIHSLVVPPNRTWVAEAVWVPPAPGDFCVRVKVESPQYSAPFYSSRNVSIVDLPSPYGSPEVFPIAVSTAGLTSDPIVVTLGIKKYLPDWQASLSPTSLTLHPGQTASAILTLTPPADINALPRDGSPIADVSAFVDGKSIGGIRKVWRPPVPLGQLGEPEYAESEIKIDPDPPAAGQTTTIAVGVRNDSDADQTVDVQFGWANFGIGIPFSSSGIVPSQTTISLTPHQATTVSAQWIPASSGSICAQALLTDHGMPIEEHSQRNILAKAVAPNDCQPVVKQFPLQNDSGSQITVTLGTRITNLPTGWAYDVEPTSAVLNPHETVDVQVTLYPPCHQPLLRRTPSAPTSGNSSTVGPVKLQVEGYDQEGLLIGGLEIDLSFGQVIYLPLITRGH